MGEGEGAGLQKNEPTSEPTSEPILGLEDSVTVSDPETVAVTVAVSVDAAWSSMIRMTSFDLVIPFELAFSLSSMIARRSATNSFFRAASVYIMKVEYVRRK